MSEYPDCNLTVYVRDECKEPRYPLFPTERPMFTVIDKGYTETEDEGVLSFDFEDEESAKAFAWYVNAGIEVEIRYKQEKP